MAIRGVTTALTLKSRTALYMFAISQTLVTKNGNVIIAESLNHDRDPTQAAVYIRVFSPAFTNVEIDPIVARCVVLTGIGSTFRNV